MILRSTGYQVQGLLHRVAVGETGKQRLHVLEEKLGVWKPLCLHAQLLCIYGPEGTKTRHVIVHIYAHHISVGGKKLPIGNRACR